MKCFRLLIAIAFVFTCCVIILRPALVFHSNALQLTLAREARSCGLVKAVRKRKERLPQMERLREEDLVFLSSPTALARKMQRLLHWIINSLAACDKCQSLLQTARSVMEREQRRHDLIYLSQFRI